MDEETIEIQLTNIPKADILELRKQLPPGTVETIKEPNQKEVQGELLTATHLIKVAEVSLPLVATLLATVKKPKISIKRKKGKFKEITISFDPKSGKSFVQQIIALLKKYLASDED